MKPHGLTPEQVKAVVEAAGRPRPQPPTAGRLNYHQIARDMFPVEQLPPGALPVYDKDPEPTCFDSDHPGFMKPMSQCDHPECVARYVLET